MAYLPLYFTREDILGFLQYDKLRPIAKKEAPTKRKTKKLDQTKISLLKDFLKDVIVEHLNYILSKVLEIENTDEYKIRSDKHRSAITIELCLTNTGRSITIASILPLETPPDTPEGYMWIEIYNGISGCEGWISDSSVDVLALISEDWRTVRFFNRNLVQTNVENSVAPGSFVATRNEAIGQIYKDPYTKDLLTLIAQPQCISIEI